MNIDLGKDAMNPIYVNCHGFKKGGGQRGVWTGMFKLHLLKPKSNGIMLLKGLRPFILSIEGKKLVGKVCKSYNQTANPSNLSVQARSDSLAGVSPYQLFMDIIHCSFKRGQECEVTEVTKGVEDAFAYIISTNPSQATKMEHIGITTQHEVIKCKRTSGEHLTPDLKAKKVALSLTLSPLPLLMYVPECSNAITTIIGTGNVIEIYYHKEVDGKHNGKANVECANPIVYKRFVRKKHVIGSNLVDFGPHRGSLEGICSLPPHKVQLGGSMMSTQPWSTRCPHTNWKKAPPPSPAKV